MASNQQIAEALESLFRETNPNSFASLNDVVLRLQSKLGLDLSHNIDFIRSHISILLSCAPPPPIPTVIHRPPVINPNPNPNPNSRISHHLHHVYHHQPVVLQPQSHFPPSFGGTGGGPRGPTEISFAQPGGTFGGVQSTPVNESTQTKPKRRGGAGGLNKLCGVSPLLQVIVGQPAMPRTEIVKQLWAYIRKHNLQDPSNKRKIICNDELRLLFETDSTDMFNMNKLLAKHIIRLDSTTDSGQQSKKLKVEDPQVTTTKLSPASSPAPASGSIPSPAPVPDPFPALASPAPAPASAPDSSATIVISDALAKFFGTVEKQMPQSEVYKRIEEYIKVEGLEDPLNSLVICDTKLQELFGCESISTPGMQEVLAREHLSQHA